MAPGVQEQAEAAVMALATVASVVAVAQGLVATKALVAKAMQVAEHEVTVAGLSGGEEARPRLCQMASSYQSRHCSVRPLKRV